jgi:DNA polymerase III delta prime subunit
MTVVDESRQQAIVAIARTILDNLRAIANAASQPLHETPVVLANEPHNSWVNVTAARVNNNRQLWHAEVRESMAAIRSEPFVARLVADNERGVRVTYYFTRGSTAGDVYASDGPLLSYRSGGLGTLASHEVGDEVTIATPGGKRSFKVRERQLLRPKLSTDGWDGKENRFDSDDAQPLSLKSLVEFLSGFDRSREVDVLLNEIEASEQHEETRRDGLRRHVVDAVQLRDRAILDKYQDEIFRLPLDQRLLLSGPPGTGKTTTLIKRIAQKSRYFEVSEAERGLVSDEDASTIFGPGNWVMYTPTASLKTYLKEAFSCEGVAASDDRVRTWADDRLRIARNVLHILKSSQSGTFVMGDDNIRVISDVTSKGLVSLYDEFVAHFHRSVAERYDAELQALSKVGEDAQIATIVRAIRRRIGEGMPTFERLFDLVELHDDLARIVKTLSDGAAKSRDEVIRRMLIKERDLVDRVAEFLRSVATDREEDEDEDEDEDRTPLDLRESRRDERAFALKVLRRAVDDAARAAFDGQLAVRTGRRRKVLDEFAPMFPDRATLHPLGKLLVTLRRVRYLSRPHQNLIERVPNAYQRFRRTAVRESAFYLSNSQVTIDQKRVEGAEVDAMILVMLRHAREFLRRHGGSVLRDASRVSTGSALLDDIRREYVTQILVDEATDFSPVQLACMQELARPEFRSFFVCGDFRQRVTISGLRDAADLDWIASDFVKKNVNIGYRQSRRLAELAEVIATIGGATSVGSEFPRHVADANIAPLLGEHLQGDDLSRWLCDRILEIEREIGFVPSIAIFVDDSKMVRPLADSLQPTLSEYSHKVVACVDDAVKGTDSQIRVFDIQHVKGFEFEAVFFVGIDALAERLPDLFDKYLFVGITRATTYLGVTCNGSLPAVLEPARSHFVLRGWG